MVVVGVPAALALSMAAVFVLGAYLIGRGGSAGVVLVGALSLVEALVVPFYARTSTSTSFCRA